MATRQVNRLSSRQCDALKDAGNYIDGNGLLLQITRSGAKSWILKFRFDGKQKEMGLGPYGPPPGVGVKEARERAAEARKLIAEGVNPIEAKKRAPVADSVAVPGVPLFGAFARSMMKSWVAEFKSKGHRRSWEKTFGNDGDTVTDPYAGPILDLPVDQIDTAEVMTVLTPLLNRNETAMRVRGRIERVLDAARILKHRTGENPARWEGHIEIMVPNAKKMARGHHKALPSDAMPAFITQLRTVKPKLLAGGKRGGGHATQEGGASISALALEFLILTASRTSEVRFARRSEIDFDSLVWTVPAERMKEGRIHRVPLTPRMVEILRVVWPYANDPDAYIFRGRAGDGHLSNMAMSMCLRGLISDTGTVHGMRSTFRDWVGEETEFPREVAEAALSHLIGDKAEQAYRRGDALKRRRKLMEAWEDWLNGIAPTPLY